MRPLRSPTACGSLHLESAGPAQGGPEKYEAATLATPCAALPPNGTGLVWGDPALRPLPPLSLALHGESG